MSHTQRTVLTLAAVLTAIPLALTGCTTIVATPVEEPTTAPTAEPIEVEKPTNEPVDPAADFVTVYDDSNIVSVNVPAAWSDVSGTQLTDSNGIVYYNVTAGTDLTAFSSGWTVPAVSVSSTQDPAFVIDDTIDSYAAGVGTECDPNPEIGDYDDGVYIGKYIYFENCGGVGTDYVSVMVQDYDATHYVICSVQMVTDEDKTTTLKAILKSFWAVY